MIKKRKRKKKEKKYRIVLKNIKEKIFKKKQKD